MDNVYDAGLGIEYFRAKLARQMNQCMIVLTGFLPQDEGPDLEYFRAKLARQIEQFCRAARRGASLGHPTVEDVLELFRATEKTRKQLELLEDSVVVYHLKHGERRNVWYIPIENPTIAATTVVENFKEWLKDRKLP